MGIVREWVRNKSGIFSPALWIQSERGSWNWGMDFIGGHIVPGLGSLILWLDATQITGVSDGDDLSTWSDLSSSGTDFTTGTAPSYHTNVQNGNAVVRFVDGSSEFLTNGASINLSTGFTCLAAIEVDTSTANNAVISKSTGDVMFSQWGTNSGVNMSESNVAGMSVEGVTGNTNWQVISGTWAGGAGGACEVFRNNSSVNSDTYNESDLTNGANCDVGRDVSAYADMDVGEIIVYSDVKGATDLSALNTYLSGKWSI